MSTRGMFRMTEVTPFDPSVLGMQNIRLDAHGRVRSGGSSTCRSSRVHPVSIGDQWADDEKTGLIGGRPKRETMSNASVVTLCAALCLWFMVVCVIFVMYWQVSSNVAAVRDTVQPFVLSAVNHTMSLIIHADNSMKGVNSMADGAAGLTQQAVPAMQLALNQTSAMITRLERLARHPTISLSLEQGNR